MTALDYAPYAMYRDDHSDDHSDDRDQDAQSGSGWFSDPRPSVEDTAAVMQPVSGRAIGRLSRDGDREYWAGQECPESTRCDGCRRLLKRGWWVRPTCGTGDRPWMCPPCWWQRWPR